MAIQRMKMWGKRKCEFAYHVRNVQGIRQSPDNSHYKTNCWIFVLFFCDLIFPLLFLKQRQHFSFYYYLHFTIITII